MAPDKTLSPLDDHWPTWEEYRHCGRRRQRWATAACLALGVVAVMLVIVLSQVTLGAELTAPEKVAVHTLVRAQAGTVADSTLWEVMVILPVAPYLDFPDFVEVRRPDSQPPEIAFTGPPGRYVIHLIQHRADTGFSKARAVVVIGVAPDPQPDPPPDTNPFHPSPAYRPTLEPVAQAEKTIRQYADRVSAMYGQLSRDVAGGSFRTYQEVADAVADRGAKLGVTPGQYPKFKAAMIASSKALPWSRPDPAAVIADRVEVAACLETIAWAVWEAGE